MRVGGRTFFIHHSSVCALLSLLLAPPLAAQLSGGPAAAPLRLRPGDAVRLQVRDEPGLSGQYIVDGDGAALLPLVGLVRVAGRDFDDVRREVVEAYGRELARPEVRLTPVLRIAVLGEVQRPGLVPVDPTYGLAEVIASAGGLTPAAARDRITLVRDGRAVLTTDVESLPSVQAALLSGDQIVVGRRGWISENLPVFIGAGTSVMVALVTALLLR